MASREQPAPISAGALMGTSRAVVGFWLAHCAGREEMLRPPMEEMFQMVLDGTLRPVVGGTYPLSEAARHTQTSGPGTPPASWSSTPPRKPPLRFNCALPGRN